MWIEKIMNNEPPHCSECGETIDWFESLCRYCLQYDTATFEPNEDDEDDEEDK